MVKLLIKVKPNSSKDEILIDDKNNITVKIRAKPVDGEANEYLVRYLAEEFEISRSFIQIEKGASSRFKRITLNLPEIKTSTLIKKYK